MFLTRAPCRYHMLMYTYLDPLISRALSYLSEFSNGNSKGLENGIIFSSSKLLSFWRLSKIGPWKLQLKREAQISWRTECYLHVPSLDAQATSGDGTVYTLLIGQMFRTRSHHVSDLRNVWCCEVVTSFRNRYSMDKRRFVCSRKDFVSRFAIEKRHCEYPIHSYWGRYNEVWGGS